MRPQDTATTPSAEPFDKKIIHADCMVYQQALYSHISTMTTNLTATAGITSSVSYAPLPTEPVLCQICRLLRYMVTSNNDVDDVAAKLSAVEPII
jgi:hypothetical protein